MSSAWLPGSPAFRPGEREKAERATDQVVTPGLAELLGRNPVRLAMGPPEPFGYYRAEDLFIKVLPSDRARRIALGDRLAADIGQHLPVAERAPEPMAGFPRRLALSWPHSGEAWVLAYRWIDVEPPDAHTGTLHAVGAGLARVHGALRVTRGIAGIRYRASRRLELLKATAEALPSRSPTLQAVAPHLALLGDFAGPDAQPVHGDLNRGNVLIGAARSGCRIVDYETALYTMAPPGFDVAFAIERIALQPGYRDGRSSALALLTGYAETAGRTPFRKDEDLPRLMALSSVRGLLILAAAEAVTGQFDRDEQEKFLSNLDLVKERRGVLLDVAAATRGLRTISDLRPI